ncbi:MAG TPA: iron ABC transporter permease [Solirubrobacteraceae bacterium]|jgi:iron(III) transport system permease protein|nr:iron ABC transporter permease [Solirubrobacteraceae bacterium]
MATAADLAAPAPSPAAPPLPRRASRLLGARRPPPLLFALGLLVAVAAALPALYLVVVVAGESAAAADAVLTSRSLGLVARSAGLAGAVTASAIAIAVPLAWLTVRSDLPGRRAWATLATLPLVMPSYIAAYVFVAVLRPKGLLQELLAPFGVSELPPIYGFVGAWLVLTLCTYPLVLIPLRAALRRLDPSLEEAARVMGRSPLEVFRTVVMPQLMPAIGGGGVLVALYVLSDFGAVAILRFDSFTREIYIAFQSAQRTEAAALGMVLVVVMLALFALYARVRGARALHRSSPGTPRPAPPVRLGRWRWPALGLCGAIVAMTLVLPVGVLVYWATKDVSSGLNAGAIAAEAGNSLLAAAAAAAAAGVAALVVGVLSVRFPGYATRAIERVGYAGYALPGIVVALALVFFGTRVALPLYQTLAMLVFALSIHYLPLAVGPVGAALMQVPPRLEEAARGLGRTPWQVFRTITRPLVTSGVLAGAALVFLHALKELPATLLLAPIGFETLATDIFRQTTTGFFEAAAIPALILLLIAAPPLYLLNEKGVSNS